MTLREFLERLTGGRYCCGDAGIPPQHDPEDLEFNLILILRLVVSCIAFAVALLVRSLPPLWQTVLLLAAALLAGLDILAGAVLSFMSGAWMDRSVLICFATLISFLFGAKVEAAALVLLYQIGGVFIDYACTRTHYSVREAIDFDPPTARKAYDNGYEIVAADELNPGDRFIVDEGERIPCDCIVLQGQAGLQLSDLGETGGPILAREGDDLVSGSLVVSGRLLCEATEIQEESTAAAFTQTVESASGAGTFPWALSMFLRYYPMAMTAIALLCVIILPLGFKITFAQAVRRAASIIVLGNPCAIAVAVPLIRFAAMGGAAREGIIFKSCEAMDMISEAPTVAFDKQGTLTEGNPRVVAVKSPRMDPKVLLKIAAHALAYSDTPEARSIIAAYGETIYIDLIENFLKIPGGGVEVQVDKVSICAGSRDLMMIKGVSVPDEDISEEQSVFLCIAGAYAGRIILNDAVRPDAPECVAELADKGVERVVFFAPDARDPAARLASELGIVEFYPEHDQARTLGTLSGLRESAAPGRSLVFVTGQDSYNAVHSDADVDVSMTGLGALTMHNRSDMYIFGGKTSRLPLAMGIAKYALMLIWLTAAAALVLKVLLLVLAIMGIAPVWFAVFIDSCAAVAAALVSILAFTGELSAPKRRR